MIFPVTVGFLTQGSFLDIYLYSNNQHKSSALSKAIENDVNTLAFTAVLQDDVLICLQMSPQVFQVLNAVPFHEQRFGMSSLR